jgi:hypothetical protein
MSIYIIDITCTTAAFSLRFRNIDQAVAAGGGVASRVHSDMLAALAYRIL